MVVVQPFDFSCWPIAVRDLPANTYLVGGAVRDALLGRTTLYPDLDFIVPAEAIALSKKLADKYQAGLVVLDRERQIARLVFANATVDIAQRHGETLLTDLRDRDFRLNAIAYDIHQHRLVDPLGGLLDLQRRQIHYVAPENLAADPLRLLRAYRQAAQLQFTITPETRQVIQRLAPQLRQVAAERVRMELSYLLSAAAGAAQVTLAFRDGVLPVWLPSVTEERITHYHALESTLANFPFPDLWPALTTSIAATTAPGEPQRRTLAALAKLTCLVNAGDRQAAEELTALTYTTDEIRIVQVLCRLLSHWLIPLEQPLNREQAFYLFRTAGSYFPAFVALALSRGVPKDHLVPLVKAWLDPGDPVAHPPQLLRGADLVEQFHLAPGPRIGELLRAVEAAQARGEVSDRPQALTYVAQILNCS
ncbi:CCA tRNA nucleotidyltransferase [Thermosynechococcus sp.]|uniref:CCA tRNA nucleotidyltransferase n=1 Tax=Thermosynechococcus sp. TaxID=2814275 RepID=UPI00391DAEBE